MGIDRVDVAILGGGLAGALVALALAERRPDLSLLLVEAGDSLGGNHIWSFFPTDIAPENRWLVAPLIVAKWPRYAVQFGAGPFGGQAGARMLGTGYCSITSDRLDAVCRSQLPPGSILTGATVADVHSSGFSLADGRSFAAGTVIDARGNSAMPQLVGGWQKFVGQMLHLAAPHGLGGPVVMDASVEQIEGFRFVYCLPFSEDTVFVEDTYYTDGPDVDVPALRARIAAYAAAQGWQVTCTTREEVGCLPVVAGGDGGAYLAAIAPRGRAAAVARVGVGGGMFHPLTGFSVGHGVATACMIASLPQLTGPAVAQACHSRATRTWAQGGYYRLLARMLFGAGNPLDRARIFARFYTLSQGLIERFYAGRLTGADRLRILAGRPPVPLVGALACILGRGRPLGRLALPPAAPQDTSDT